MPGYVYIMMIASLLVYLYLLLRRD